jgi:hypothetical protein
MHSIAAPRALTCLSHGPLWQLLIEIKWRVQVKIKLAAAALVGMGLMATAAQATTIDFSGLANGTAVTTQYAGVVFSLQGGPDSSGPPTTNNYSGEALANSTNPDYPTANILNVAFSSAVSGLSFTFNNYGTGAATTYTAFNASDAVVSSGDLQFVNDFTLINMVAGSGFTDLQFNNNNGGDNWYYAVQELTYSVSSTPLPSTWTMLVGGLLGVGFFAYRGSKKNAAALAA